MTYSPDTGAQIVAHRLAIQITGDGQAPGIVYRYRHPERPEFDSDVEYQVATDGSLESARFECATIFPASENDHCDGHLGGYGGQNGAAGVFFGISLLAGMTIPPSGLIERDLMLGTRHLSGVFQVTEPEPGILEIRAANEETRDLPFGGIAVAESIGYCSIFTGRVQVDARTGTPLLCMIADPDAGFLEYGWRLNTTTATPTSPRLSIAVPPALPLVDGGQRMPPEADEEEMPFGLYEALNEARSRDARVADFLAKEDYFFDQSLMSLRGGSGTGDCAIACVRQVTWHWNIALQAPSQRMTLEMTKTIAMPSGVATMEIVSLTFDDVLTPARIFPPSIASPGELWRNAREDFGFSPTGFHYVASLAGQGRQVAEPFLNIILAAPAGEGLAPNVWYNTAGEIVLWSASGAQREPFIDDCACSATDACC